MSGKFRVLFFIVDKFSERNIFESKVLELLGEQKSVETTIITNNSEHEKRLQALGYANLKWKQKFSLKSEYFSRNYFFIFKYCVYKLFHLVLLLNRAQHKALCYRFNHLKRFNGHKIRLSMPTAKKRQFHPDDRTFIKTLGWPFGNSERVYRFLFKLHFWSWGVRDKVLAFFKKEKFDLLVLSHIQNHVIFSYAMAAKMQNIPILGIVASWDQPTLRGPINPFVNRYIVQNKYMSNQLARYHRIPAEKTVTTGWLQMDKYFKAEIIAKKGAFFDAFKIPSGSKLVLFGANPFSHGRYEPDILEHLLRRNSEKVYGPAVYFWLRTHPNDTQWETRFKKCLKYDSLYFEKGGVDDYEKVINTITHSDIVISTAGTIALEAVALKTNSISLNFDGDKALPLEESSRMFYEFEHYKSVIKTKGTVLVDSYAELDAAVAKLINDPNCNESNMNRLRALHIEPFDGRSSERLVSQILDFRKNRT